MNVCVKVFVNYRLGLIKHLVRRSMTLIKVLLLLHHANWWILHSFCCQDLSLDHGGNPSLVVSKSHLIDIALSDVLILVLLNDFILFHGVYLEMLICNDHLLVEVVDLLLAHLSELFHHVVT